MKPIHVASFNDHRIADAAAQVIADYNLEHSPEAREAAKAAFWNWYQQSAEHLLNHAYPLITIDCRFEPWRFFDFDPESFRFGEAVPAAPRRHLLKPAIDGPASAEATLLGAAIKAHWALKFIELLGLSFFARGWNEEIYQLEEAIHQAGGETIAQDPDEIAEWRIYLKEFLVQPGGAQ